MTEQSRKRQLGHAMAAGVGGRDGPDRDPSWRRSVPDEEVETLGPARPLEFDANGFPVAQSNPSFVSRVARLLSAT